MFGQPTLLFFAALKSNPLMAGEHENQRREFFTYPVVPFPNKFAGWWRKPLSYVCIWWRGRHVSLYDSPRGYGR